jgi:hypothetical protein
MANWCSNTVSFTGEQHQLDELGKLFTQMADKEKAENKGQLPPFITEDKDWLFEISWEYETLYYETRWTPNIEVIQQIADHFGVGFVHSYCETGNLVFGEATYENGALQDIFLEPGDFDQYEFDEDTDTYLFDGERYESSDEIMDILLERKKLQTLN